LTAQVLAGVIGIAFLAASCQSLTGFGFALVMVPLLSLFWDVKLAVVTTTLLGTAALMPLVVEAWEHVRIWKVIPLVVGSMVGVPFGLLILDRIDPEALKIFVAAVVIGASLILYFAPRMRIGGSGPASPVAVGVLSGILRASTSMGGPPVVLYTLSREREADEFRGTLLAFFVPSSLMTVLGLGIVGRLTPKVAGTAAAALPAMTLGLVAGIWLRTRVNEELFRTLVLVVLVLSSIGVIISATGIVG
jgi:uncharacterized membrane protein YfcA